MLFSTGIPTKFICFSLLAYLTHFHSFFSYYYNKSLYDEALEKKFIPLKNNKDHLYFKYFLLFTVLETILFIFFW